jgi:hypothetical protein
MAARERAGGGDHPLAIGGVQPGGDRMEQVTGVAMGERGCFAGNTRHALPDPEDDHLAERRAEGDQVGGVGEEYVDRRVAEFWQVLSAGVEAAEIPGRERVEDRLEGGVGHRADVVDSGAKVPERLHRGGSFLRITDVEHWSAEHRLAAQLRWDEFLRRREDHGTAG